MMLLVMVFLPVFAAFEAYWLCRRSERAAGLFSVAVTALIFAMSVSLFFLPAQRVEAPGFFALGLSLRTGSLRTVMTALASFLWLMTALASPEYFAGAQRNARYYCFYLWTLGPLLGVFLASDLMTLFLFFEVMSFTSYVWVAQNETPEALRASETYLFVAVVGGLTMLMGIFLLYDACGTLSFEALVRVIGIMPLPRRLAVGLCLLTGFGAKAGMFPLHIWLPKAHPVAPAPASALLSGILTKSGVFGVIAVSIWMFEGVESWGLILLVPAVITMVLGAVLAVFSVDLKRTLACSSMSQIGFILTGVSMCSLLGEHGAIAASGAALHVLNHSLIKLTLFVAAGVVYRNLHALELNGIRGFGRGKPLLMLAFLSGACSIAGIPGFLGYVSKTLLHEGIVEYAAHAAAHGGSAAPWYAVEWLFLFSGGLTLAYMARLFYILFLAAPPAQRHEKPGPYMRGGTAAVLVIGGLLLPALGLSAHASLDRIAAYALPFFRRAPLDHAVHYFAWVNLKGAVISITIGTLVFALVGMRLLTRREGGAERYLDLWPKRLDLEDALYRPLLRALAAVGAVAARAVETLGAALVLGTVDLIFLGARRQVRPPEDENFSGYVRSRSRSLVDRSFSLDLLLAALGVLALLLLVLFNL